MATSADGLLAMTLATKYPSTPVIARRAATKQSPSLIKPKQWPLGHSRSPALQVAIERAVPIFLESGLLFLHATHHVYRIPNLKPIMALNLLGNTGLTSR